MLLTLDEAKASRELSSVAGVCTDSDTFISLLNQSTRKLMTRGDFWGTVQKVRICVRDHCIVWPRWVGRISATKNCRHLANDVNFWHEFLPMTNDDICGHCEHDFFNVVHSGHVPVYRPIECDPKYLRVFIERQSDIGKKIVFFGIDYNGQPIRTVHSDGNFRDGVELIFAMPYVTSPFPLKGVNRAVKDVTEGPVRVYQWDSAHDTLLDMAVYDPDETSPAYRYSMIHDRRARCSCPQAVQTLVKLEFIPVRYAHDRVLIENLDALQLMMTGCKLIEQGNISGARDAELEAIRELNLELRNRFPPEQTAVSNRVFGNAPLSRHTAGMI